MEFIKIVTFGDLVSLLMAAIVYMMKRELHHINESIKGVKECAIEAKQSASKAHERIDSILKN